MKNFNPCSESKANGTFLQGYIEADFKRLCKVFGEPSESDGYKCDAEWTIEFENGQIATIYNYKNGKNYRGVGGLEKEVIKEWHIGGKNPDVVEWIKEILIYLPIEA